MAELMTEYDGDLRVVYLHFVEHEWARLAAEASCAAAEQGQFAAMEKPIWERAYSVSDFGSKNIENLARRAGLDLHRTSFHDLSR